MAEVSPCTYEEIPYESLPFPATHPSTLAVMATLHGLTPPPVTNCRVLELGCAAGGNLLPMALTLPNSQFVGIDLSPRQITGGRELVEALGVKNLQLEARSILDVNEDFGTFDYILCHGVYSWVPPAVQDKILSICSRNLAPNGIAYVSYNTFPGWNLRGLLRGMLSFHSSHFTEPKTRLFQARAFLDLLAKTVEGSEQSYFRVIADELELLRPQADSYLFHEHLEDVNAPVYFHQFVERAVTHNLQFLEEAQFLPVPTMLPEAVREIYRKLPVGRIHHEQYFDFIRGTAFRRSLLCHADLPVTSQPLADKVPLLRLTANAQPVSSTPDLDSDAREEFRGPDGRSATTNSPGLKAALATLYQLWPRSLTYPELRERLQARSGKPVDEPRLAEGLLHCAMTGLAELHVHVVDFPCEPSERPVAWPLTRLQAAADSDLVSNLRHRSVKIGEFEKLVLRLLDGSRDRLALRETLTDLAMKGALTLEKDGRVLSEPDEVRELIDGTLPGVLDRLAASGLLVA